MDSQLKFFENEKDLVFLFLKELCGSEMRRKVLARMLSDCLEVMREAIIEEGIENGAFRVVNPELATSSLFVMITISAFHYLAYSRPVDREPVKSTVEEIFFKGILNGKDGICRVAGRI